MSSRGRSNFKRRERSFREWHKRFEKAPTTTLGLSLHSCFLAGWRESRRFLLEQIATGTLTMTDGQPIAVLTATGRKHLETSNEDRSHTGEPNCQTCKGTGWITTNFPNGPDFQCSCPDCNDATHELLD